VILAETAAGLARPAGGRLAFGTLSPAALTRGGFSTFGVLAVVAVLGFVGFEQAPRPGRGSQESPADRPGREPTWPLGAIAVVLRRSQLGDGPYGTGRPTWSPRRASRGRGCCSGWPGTGSWLRQRHGCSSTSLFAAALAFHNLRLALCVRARPGEKRGCLPRSAGTGRNSVPRAASAAQSVTGLIAIAVTALAGLSPMNALFFGLGTTGGFGILILLAVDRGRGGSRSSPATRAVRLAWRRLAAPGLAAVLLAVILVLAVLHYGTLARRRARQPGRVGAAGQLRRRDRRRDRVGAGPAVSPPGRVPGHRGSAPSQPAG